jgi:trimethylamine--corrinoid protein Co-methyltransferase
MSIKGFRRNFKFLEILTEEQVEAITSATLQVLEETGVRVDHKKALTLLEGHGCAVNHDTNTVKMPPGLVEECLRKCPSSFLIKARDPKDNVVIGGNVTYFKNSCGMQTIDLDTWEPRVPTKKDNDDAIRILDSLENLHILGSYTAYFGFEGVPPVMAILESCASKTRNSTKVQIEGFADDSEVFQIQMAQAVGTEILQQITASAPLTWGGAAMEAVFRAVGAGFPLLIVGGQVLGGTAPVTLAGALTTNNAELIVPIVIAQLIKPGTRVLPTDFVFPMNMHSGSPGFGSIGCSLHQVAFNQIWRKYDIPAYDANSGYVSSKFMDFQAGYEKANQAVLAAVSGAHLIGMHGAVSAELTFHPVQAILDDDLAGMIGRFLRGILVNEDTLALDIISHVGPIPGHYLGEEHTRKWWMKEQFIPEVADRLSYPEWIATGKKTALDYAREKMEEILATHHPKPVTPSQEEEIDKILEEARRHYKKNGKL